MTKPTKRITTGQLFLIGLIALFAGSASAQEMSGLFRYVTEDGDEIYAARPEGRATMDSMDTHRMINLLGFIYIEEAPNTIPLYCMRKQNISIPNQYFLTANPSDVKALKKQDWKFYPQTDGPIGWVSAEGGKGMRGAKVFRQSDVETDFGNRIRFQGEELDLWKTHPAAVVSSNPSFYVWWKERDVAAPKPSGPTPAKITGQVITQSSQATPKPSGHPPIKIIPKPGRPDPIISSQPTPKPGRPSPILTPTPAKITGQIITKPPEPAGKVDIGFRYALYNNGSQTVDVNKLMPYATPTIPLVLSHKDAIWCDQGWCAFNFGVILYRNTNTEDHETYAILYGGNPKSERSFTTFTNGSKTADVVIQVAIHDGENSLAVVLNPFDLQEINKENNSFSVKIILKP